MKKYYVEIKINEGQELEAENEDDAKQILKDFIVESIDDAEVTIEEIKEKQD